MKVKKLIEALQEMPPEAEVACSNAWGFDVWFITSAKLERGFEREAVEGAVEYSDHVEHLDDVFDSVILE